MRGRLARAVAVALLGAGLAACGGRAPTPSPTVEPTASPTSGAGAATSASASPEAATSTAAGRCAHDRSAAAGVFAPRAARLEAGPQTGYRFSATGAVDETRTLSVVNAPLAVTVDRRRTVPTRPGLYLRVTTGDLAGFEVLESPISFLTGIAGNTGFTTPRSVTLPAGAYLTYRFDEAWQLAGTRAAAVRARTSASAERRAVIQGRPYVLMSSGEWSGWWMPITRPLGVRAQPITCEVPTKPSAGSSQTLSRIPTEEPEVALTLDLGGRLEPALRIVNRLILDRVCVTVNPTGATALTAEGTAVMRLIAAHPELFEVGNHTMNHCNLVTGGDGPKCPADRPTTAQLLAELTRADDVIRDLTGWRTAPFWRPPFGAYDDQVRAAAAGVGYTKTLMWDVDTIDWKRTVDGGPTALSMQDKVVSRATTGSIVLMHLGGYHTCQALPGMVWRLRQAGLTPTTVSDLLADPGR